MKKLIVVCAVLFMAVLPCYAGLGGVSAIKISSLQGDGFHAVYDGTTIEWNGGASITFYDGDEAPIITLDNAINLYAVFSDVTDYSSGTVARAQFEVISWHIDFGAVTLLSGTNVNGVPYVEEEQTLPYPPFNGSGTLSGVADVLVTGGLLQGGWNYGGQDFQWEDTTYDAAQLISEIIVPAAFDTYVPVSGKVSTYDTYNTTMWLYADETIIPEPATMILLGIGSVVLGLRRRNA